MAIRARRFCNVPGVRLYEAEMDTAEELATLLAWCMEHYLYCAITGEFQCSGMIPLNRPFDLTLQQMNALPEHLVFDMDCSNEKCLFHQLSEADPVETCPRCGNKMEACDAFTLESRPELND